MLTEDIFGFELLGPDIFLTSLEKHVLWVLIRNAMVRMFAYDTRDLFLAFICIPDRDFSILHWC